MISWNIVIPEVVRMELAKITAKGQLTLPKKVRDVLDVDVGDNVVFIARGNGFMLFSEKVVESGEMIIDNTDEKE